ncbi:hypothetical protein [Helcococcus sueciensis]|uniref:hypothetical protein n=1 Tax=Helcococcus sueciensis TaxID=241555 RepID=UPI0004172090|nr:hypothetical protein [Helcococcus sueciensis]
MKKYFWLFLFGLVFLIVIIFWCFNYNMINISNSWDMTISSSYTTEVLYESDRGFQGDGEKIIKLDSDNLEYKIECSECYKVIELDKDTKLISEILSRAKLKQIINIHNLRIIDSIKQNKNKDDYFKYLIITSDINKKTYYIFEMII